MINKERILKRFLKYVKIDSPTKHERRFAEILKKDMEELGLSVEMDDAYTKIDSDCGNLIGRLKGTSGDDTILLSAHMDTVSPGRGIKPVIKDGVIHSDGTTILGSDDKAGISAIMEAIETLVENNIPHPNVEVVFSIYEEQGLYGAKTLDYSKIKSKTSFIFDSSSSPGKVITGAPSQNKITARFIGKKAHAGISPETGISAIQMASEAIANMPLLRIDEETTANVGMIEGGGATNVVTQEVLIKAEARSHSNEKLEKQTEAMRKACIDSAEKFGGKVEIDVDRTYSGFSINEGDDIINRLRDVCNTIGVQMSLTLSGGGGDANIFNEHGIKGINLGVGMSAVHTLEEHISIKDLEDSGELALAIIKSYA